MLEDLTFPTIIVPLARERAEGLVAYLSQSVDGKFVGPASLAARLETDHIKPWLAELDVALQQVRGAGDLGAFVRLSSRSGKDAALRSPEIHNLFEGALASAERDYPGFDESSYKGIVPILILSHLDDEHKNNNNQNQSKKAEQHTAITRACGQALRVTSGGQVLAQWMRSQRVLEDLKMAIEGGQFTLQVIVRQWAAIRQENELRAFVCGGRLCALTQYYSDCFSPLLASRKSEVAAAVQKYFAETLHPRMSIDHYVFDAVLNPDLSLSLVEINTPPPVAGQSLFETGKPEDFAILENGPFEFRVLAGPTDLQPFQLFFRSHSEWKRAKNKAAPLKKRTSF